MLSVNINCVIDRFQGLLELQKVLYLEKISATFNEHDLKEILYLLRELKSIKEVAETENIQYPERIS